MCELTDGTNVTLPASGRFYKCVNLWNTGSFRLDELFGKVVRHKLFRHYGEG